MTGDRTDTTVVKPKVRVLCWIVFAAGALAVAGTLVAWSYWWRPNVEDLHRAVFDCDVNRVASLLHRGADPNVRLRGRAPLHVAIAADCADCAERLLNAGADPHAVDASGTTPLWLAFRTERVSAKVIQMLVAHGADPDEVRYESARPLLYAASADLGDVVRVLVEGGADVEARAEGMTPLMIAAVNSSTEIAQILIDGGANIEAADGRGFRTLHLAVAAGNVEVVELLLAEGADANARLEVVEKTPLHDACRIGDAAIVDRLLVAGAEIEARDRDGVTPLMYAAHYGHASVAKALLLAGADPTAVTEQGDTALKYAQIKGHQEVIAVLRQ